MNRGPAIARSFAHGLFAAVVYAALGLFSVLLAPDAFSPPPIWLAAGFALYWALMRPPHELWGIAAGAWAVAFHLLPDASLSAQALVGTFGIGIGALLQAYFGARLLRPYQAARFVLADPLDATRFLIFGGPIASFINATIATVVFLKLETIRFPEAPYAWFSWWVGDSFGSVVGVVLLLCLLPNHGEVWRRRRRALALPLALLSVAVVLGFLFVHRTEADRARAAFANRGKAVQAAIQSSLVRHLEATIAIGAAFEASREVDRAEFRVLVRSVLDRYRGVFALYWVPVVQRADLGVFVESIQKEGLADFHIYAYPAANPEQTLQDSEAFPVTFVEPMHRSGDALGRDFASEPTRRDVILEARRTGEPRLTRPMRLLSTGRPGFLVAAPVFRHGRDHSAQERALNFLGVVAIVYHVNDFLAAALTGTDRNGLKMRITAEGAASRPYLDEFDGATFERHHLDWTETFEVAGQRVRVDVRSTPEYAQTWPSWTPWYTLLGGLAFVIVVAALLLSGTARAAHIEALVSERTEALLRTNLELQAVASDLKTSRAYYQAVLESSPDAIFTLNSSRLIRDASPSTETLFGIPAAKVVGKSIVELLPEFDEEAVNQLIAGGSRSWQAKRGDGRFLPVEVAAARIHVGQEELITVNVHDLTEPMKAERLKDEFVATVSHELRTPLTSIRGALGLMAGGVVGPVPANSMEMLRIALSNTEKLLRLVNDLLDAAKLEAGAMELKTEPLELSLLVERTLESNRAWALAKGVHLERTAIVSPSRVLADPMRLEQVLANLVSNAIKFSPENSAVDVRIDRVDGWLRVSVRDRGPGIPEDFRANLFQKFAQADASDGRLRGGTGLGLAIAKALIERFGGRIGYEQARDSGSVFYFELPEVPADR